MDGASLVDKALRGAAMPPPRTLHAVQVGVAHRRRHTSVLKGLHRGVNLAVRSDKARLCGTRAVVDFDTPCGSCHRMLGDKVVVGLPGGTLLCARCAEEGQTDKLVPQS